MGSYRSLRITFVLVFAAGLLPLAASPVRAITVPTTLARTVSSSGEAARTNFAFAPTHVAFSWVGDEGTGIRYRVGEGGAFSPWKRAPEAHDMEHGEHHYSGVLSVDRPDDLEWEVTGSPRAEVRDVTVDYLNTIDGPRRTIEIPAGAEAAASSPDIITRAEWGADESLKGTSGDCERTFYDVQQLFVHHTVGSNDDPHPKATMRSIYWFHVVRRGWCDIGYNFVVGSDGRLFEGRWARNYAPWEKHDSENALGQIVTGAHVADHNAGSIGVSLMGNYSAIRLPKVMRRTLVNFLAWEADRHNLPPRGRHTYVNPETGLTRRLPYIAGHRDAGQTECPGNYVYSSLPGIRESVKKKIGEGKPLTRVTLDPVDTITFGESADVTGRLTTKGGEAIVGQTVVLHGRPVGEKWSRMGLATTGPDGRFAVPVAANRNTVLAAEFKDMAGYWGDESPWEVLGVRPLVTLEAKGGTEVDGTYYFPTGTAAVPLRGSVSPTHPNKSVALTIARQRDDDSFETVAEKSVPLSDRSRFKYDFAGVEENRVYRVRARISAHADHAAGLSQILFVVVGDPIT